LFNDAATTEIYTITRLCAALAAGSSRARKITAS
jgi:hypothetical protein